MNNLIFALYTSNLTFSSLPPRQLSSDGDDDLYATYPKGSRFYESSFYTASLFGSLAIGVCITVANWVLLTRRFPVDEGNAIVHVAVSSEPQQPVDEEIVVAGYK